MQKIGYLICFVVCIGLTGCATTGTENISSETPTNLPPTGYTAKTLTTNEINQAMDDQDRSKLTQLVATAPAQYSTSWDGTKGSSFDFTSFTIFVNDNGQPCRDYQVTGSIRHLIVHSKKQMQATACRLDDMNWHIMKVKVLDQ